MNTDLFAALVTFCAVTLFTPGPNNLMLMTSGLNFGIRRTQPHLLGVALGFSLMVLLVGLGIGQVFTAYPAGYTLLKYAGALYLLTLAWVIANAGPIKSKGDAGGNPLTFLQAAAFQWVNPKAWVMAVSGVTTYAAIAVFPWNAVVMAVLFGAIGLVSSGVWVLFGHGLQQVLTSSRSVRIFNWTMAALLVASLYPVFWDSGPR
jgi:threonine/homoserine/homoserine lactone efflux protein